MNHVIIHLGVVWIVKISCGWYSDLKAFPQAIDKKGEPFVEHPLVLKYIKEHLGDL
jgi:hypothetical protein